MQMKEFKYIVRYGRFGTFYAKDDEALERKLQANYLKEEDVQIYQLMAIREAGREKLTAVRKEMLSDEMFWAS